MESRHRAFVKIEDGCSNFCSYCIIPYARGPVRCKDKDLVIKELQNIAALGYKEVVLAGIHTGHYTCGKDYHLSHLLHDIIKNVPSKIAFPRTLLNSSILAFLFAIRILFLSKHFLYNSFPINASKNLLLAGIFTI